MGASLSEFCSLWFISKSSCEGNFARCCEKNRIDSLPPPPFFLPHFLPSSPILCPFIVFSSLLTLPPSSFHVEGSKLHTLRIVSRGKAGVDQHNYQGFTTGKLQGFQQKIHQLKRKSIFTFILLHCVKSDIFSVKKWNVSGCVQSPRKNAENPQMWQFLCQKSVTAQR